jgi:CRP-like cAMP-binding protein
LEFLAQLAIFEPLYEDELRALAQICQEYEFDEGAVIAYQRDIADGLYVVRAGRLFARSVDDRGIVRDTQAYQQGDYFGDTWMFAPTVHPATVKATEEGRLIIIDGTDFLQFLERNPRVLAKLAPKIDELDNVESGLSLEAWEEAQKSRLKADRKSAAISLLPDELVEFQARRSRWYLLLRVTFPTFGLLVAPLLVFVLLGGQPAESLLYSARWIMVILLAVVFGLWLAFQALDWSNDYFVITNKHLAHHEFSLRSFRTTVNKIPIDQIQSVEVERPSFVANLFDYGTARVTTAAQAGAIRFDSIDDPGQVEETLNRLRQRVQAMDAGRAQATMRAAIEGHFQVLPAYQSVEGQEDEDDELEPIIEKSSGLLAILVSFRNRYRWRVEANGVITYRKHLFVLMREAAWPTGLALLLLMLSYIVFRAAGTPSLQLLVVFSLLYAIDLGWLLWELEDWRNDTFQLTDRYVIDIDRRPFGFGESRKQAELSNVQNVSSDRPNFLATIFNYGSVIIETAGATADITFENVSHPNVIQSEVFKRRDQNRQRQLMKEGDRRRKEYSVLLDVYQQAMEQERLPRRTPPKS